MATDICLKKLEDRLLYLENQVGVSHFRGNDTSLSTTTDQLYKVKQSLNVVTSGREGIHRFWKRLDELNEVLNPQVEDRLTLTDEVKADILLAEREHILEQAALLEQVQKLKMVFDSEHIKATLSLSDRLHPLGVIQLDQQEQLQHLSDNVKQLLESYNHIITLISKQFVQWDELLTRYEISKQIRKSNEFI